MLTYIFYSGFDTIFSQSFFVKAMLVFTKNLMLTIRDRAKNFHGKIRTCANNLQEKTKTRAKNFMIKKQNLIGQMKR